VTYIFCRSGRPPRLIPRGDRRGREESSPPPAAPVDPAGLGLFPRREELYTPVVAGQGRSRTGRPAPRPSPPGEGPATRPRPFPRPTVSPSGQKEPERCFATG